MPHEQEGGGHAEGPRAGAPSQADHSGGEREAGQGGGLPAGRAEQYRALGVAGAEEDRRVPLPAEVPARVHLPGHHHGPAEQQQRPGPGGDRAPRRDGRLPRSGGTASGGGEDDQDEAAEDGTGRGREGPRVRTAEQVAPVSRLDEADRRGQPQGHGERAGGGQQHGRRRRPHHLDRHHGVQDEQQHVLTGGVGAPPQAVPRRLARPVPPEALRPADRQVADHPPQHHGGQQGTDDGTGDTPAPPEYLCLPHARDPSGNASHPQGGAPRRELRPTGSARAGPPGAQRVSASSSSTAGPSSPAPRRATAAKAASTRLQACRRSGSSP